MTSVVVAVNGGAGVGGKGSRRAFRWAAENLLPKADRFIIVHVMPTVTAIPTPCIYLSLFSASFLSFKTNFRSWILFYFFFSFPRIWGKSTSQTEEMLIRMEPKVKTFENIVKTKTRNLAMLLWSEYEASSLISAT